MSGISKLGVFKRLGLFVAVVLGLLVCSPVVHAGLAPDFTLTDIDGGVFSLSSFRGQVVLIEFFTSYCSDCINYEIPQLKIVRDTLGSKVAILSLTADPWTDSDVVLRQFRSDYGVTWTMARDPGQTDTAGVYHAYQQATGNGNGVPALYIVDGNGYLTHYHLGGTAASVLMGEIQALLGVTLTVVSARTVVRQGVPLPINLTLENGGTSTETFNTTVYANTTMVGTPQLVGPLTSGESTTIPFSWNTTGVPYGNYTISAYAQPVSGGTSADDNFTSPVTVMVTMPGDVMPPFGVFDMKDIAYVAKHFGTDPSNTDPSKPRWDPDADVNGSGKVDMKDIAIVAKNFGRHYP